MPHFLAKFLVLLEEGEGLSLEVVEFVAQLPDLILSVLLLDDLVEFVDHFLCLLPHAFNLPLHDGVHLVFMVLQLPTEVFIEGTHQLVHFEEVTVDGLFGFPE